MPDVLIQNATVVDGTGVYDAGSEILSGSESPALVSSCPCST